MRIAAASHSSIGWHHTRRTSQSEQLLGHFSMSWIGFSAWLCISSSFFFLSVYYNHATGYLLSAVSCAVCEQASIQKKGGRQLSRQVRYRAPASMMALYFEFGWILDLTKSGAKTSRTSSQYSLIISSEPWRSALKDKFTQKLKFSYSVLINNAEGK